MDLYLRWGGGGGGGEDSVHCGFYQDTSTFKKAGVMPCWHSAEMHGLLFSSIYTKFGKFPSTSQCDCMSRRGNKCILRDFLITGIAPCYVELMVQAYGLRRVMG